MTGNIRRVTNDVVDHSKVPYDNNRYLGCYPNMYANVTSQLPCGHNGRIGEDCLKKCNKFLACGHYCKGICLSCSNGRAHVPCEQVCQKILPCGHKCREKCCRDCPPCMLPAEASCEHTFDSDLPCGRDFGNCTERCTWACKHLTCDLPCGDVCKRTPCNFPCSNVIQKCGHKCLGLCSELCPELCRTCNPLDDNFLPFLGNEDNPDAMFITLPECKHSFEVNDLDRQIEEHGIKCPKCSHEIRSAKRYFPIIKASRIERLDMKRAAALSFDKQNRMNAGALRRYYEEATGIPSSLPPEDALVISKNCRLVRTTSYMLHVHLMLLFTLDLPRDRFESLRFAIEAISLIKFAEETLQDQLLLGDVWREFDELVRRATARVTRPLDETGITAMRSEFYRIIFLADVDQLCGDTIKKLSGSTPLHKLRFLSS